MEHLKMVLTATKGDSEFSIGFKFTEGDDVTKESFLKYANHLCDNIGRKLEIAKVFD